MVEYVVRTYGTKDPFGLSHKLNLHLMPSRTPSRLWGVLIYHEGEGFFSYDITAPATVQTMYVAHGIAHHLLHREHSSLFIELDEPGPSIWEAEAREFAHHLLFATGFTASSSKHKLMS